MLITIVTDDQTYIVKLVGVWCNVLLYKTYFKMQYNFILFTGPKHANVKL
jgi:hypothetical protein